MVHTPQRWLKFGNWIRFTILLIFVGIGVAFTNCDNVIIRVKPPATTSQSSVRESLICTEPPQGPDVKARVLFVVDLSGSNFSGNDGRGTGTDPDKEYRVGAIRRFVNSHANNKKIGYGLIGFSGTAAYSFISNSSSQPIYSSDLTQVDAALENLRIAVDSGATPYKAALALVKQAID
ncbi:MAG: VWA domain-containing protein, partial [Proteobacteria bacterium]